jgi:amidase
MPDELALLDATAHAELIRSGELSPREAVDAAIARVEHLNPKLNAVIIPLFEKARARAAARDLPDGPFRGVPILFKDLLCYTAGDPHHMGARPLRDAGFIVPHDAYLATRFYAAGFIPIGRTNVPELGTLPTTESDAYGAARNPWDPSRSTGGSASSSAAWCAKASSPARCATPPRSST